MTKPKHGVHAFMKKIAAFIIMMICLATSNALAADYSEACGRIVWKAAFACSGVSNL